MGKGVTTSSIFNVIDANLLKRGEEHFTVKLDCILSIMKLAMDCSNETTDERINMRDVMTTFFLFLYLVP